MKELQGQQLQEVRDRTLSKLIKDMSLILLYFIHIMLMVFLISH